MTRTFWLCATVVTIAIAENLILSSDVTPAQKPPLMILILCWGLRSCADYYREKR